MCIGRGCAGRCSILKLVKKMLIYFELLNYGETRRVEVSCYFSSNSDIPLRHG